MSFETLLYSVDEGIATITLNRPDSLNTIVPPMPDELEAAVHEAIADRAVKVIVLRGAGRAFCAGFDFGEGFHHWDEGLTTDGQWDPGKDFAVATAQSLGPVPKFMSMWRSPKPVISQVHGWCVGGGTDMALCSDLIYMAEDAQIGYPPARIWGEPTTVMWAYRLGLETAKRLMLTGQSLTGAEAVRVGLASASAPAADLPTIVDDIALKMATIPLNQLVMSKLLVNQAYENMGLRTTQMLGTFFDGIARHTPEGIAWRDEAMKGGFRDAVRRRDAPWSDYGERAR